MKKLVALLLAVSLVGSMTACGSKEEEEKPAESTATETETEAPSADAAEAEDLTWGLTPFEEPQTLRLGFFTGSPLSYPFLFADNLGVFDALNIEVEYTCFTGGPAMMEANAEWDMASCGLGGLANGLYGYDFQLVDITDYEDNLAIFARPDSEIAKDPTNPEVWKGVTCVYPAGTTAQAVLAKYLNNMDLTLADVESVNMDNANALTGFNGGTGDVLGCWNAIALSAEDAGYVRISDSGQLGIGMPCGTFATKDMMENNFDLVVTACVVFHKATEWCYESEENMAQAATWYLEHCDEEGFLCDESIATRTMDWYHGPTVDEWIELFTKTSPDDAGLYTERDLLQAEKDILVGLDFFISEGKYTNEDRTKYLDEQRIDPSVALAAKELLGK
ncbi:MAG: ABC transporter substrate-binding protein [Clostridiales bacterium]|nr:ABC transporter substrate-binding protein [Clostridiales bacterium]